MAKISQLPSLDQPTGDEHLVALRGSETVRVKVSDMVAGAVAPVTDAVDGLKQSALAYIGRPANVQLVDGTPKGVGAVYWHHTVAQAGSLYAVDVYDKGAGTVNVAVYRGGLNALVRVARSTFATTGTRTSRRIALANALEVHAGDVLAVQGPDGALSVAEVQSGDAGYTYSYPDLPDTIALGDPTTNGQVQVRFVISYREQVVTADSFLAAEANARLGAVAAEGIDLLSADSIEFIGRPGDAPLVDGTPVSTGAVYWRDAVDHAGTFASLDLFDKTAAIVRVAVYRGPVNALARIALTSVTTTGTGSLHRLALAAPIEVLPGDIIALQASIEGAYSVAQEQSGDAGYTYSYPDLPATMALDAPTTNGQLQVRFRITYRQQVVTADSVAALGAIKIGGPRAVALSSDAKPKGYVSWKTSGAPIGHMVTWDGHTVNLGAFDQEMRFPDYSLAKPFTFVGNSLSDSTDVRDRYSQVLAARYGQPFYFSARYSSDSKQVYRIGAKPIVLTLAGTLPSVGSVAVTKINGAAINGDNPAAFLTTGDPYVVSGMSMSGYLQRNGVTCRATVSAPNGASFAYTVTQTPGQPAITFDGPVTFVPDIALSVRDTTCVVWMGNNYFFSGVPNAYGDHTNPQMWVDLKLIVAFLQARGCRVLLLPVIPSADWTTTGLGTPMTASRAANARTETMFPDLYARHADRRDLIQFLQDRNDGSPEARDDVARGFTPRNLRRKPDGSYDLLHMYGDGSGDLAVADFVDSALQAQVLPPSVTQSTKFVITAVGTDLHPSDVALVGVSRDPIADIADSVNGALSNAEYRPTLASAIADFDVGTYFTSRDLGGETEHYGIKRQYQVIATPPYWADRGAWSNAADVGLTEVDNTRDIKKPVSEATGQAIALAKTDALASTSALAMMTAGALDKRIRTDAVQDLTSDDRAVARLNLSAPSTDDLANARADALASTNALATLTDSALASISQRAGALGAGTNATQAVNYAVLSKLFNTPGVSPIVLDRAQYDIGPNSLRISVKNTEVWGAPGGTTITCSVLKLLELLSIENVHFYDINFVSTFESLADEATYALVCGIHRAIRNVTMNRCTFSIAKANANALKFVADIDGEYVEQVKFNDCHIVAAGRMGAELSVHPNTLTIPGTNQKYPNDAIARIDTFEWNGGSIQNTGLISPLYGMAFSGTGWMNRIRVVTRLNNNMTCGVEGVGICNSYISLQITNMRDVAGTSTPSAAISLTANPELDRSRKMTGNVVEDCIVEDGTCREVRFWYQQGLQTRGNRFKLSAGSAGRGYVTYAGSSFCKSVNDVYDCDGSYTLQVRSEAAHGGASAFNEWEGLVLNHARSTSPFQLTNFFGADTTGNSINGVLYTPSTLYPSQPLSAGQAEATITASITGTTMTVTAWSGIPLRAGQKLFGNSIDALTEIKALDGTGTGGLGTYTVSKSQNAGSDTIKVGLAQKNFIRGSIRSTYGFDFLTNTYTIGDFSVDATLLDSVPHMLASRNMTIRTSGSLTAVRSIIWPEGGPVQRITNSTTGGFAITLKNKTAGSAVTIANGATVNVASTPTGFVIIP